jgi:hypothetical protein
MHAGQPEFHYASLPELPNNLGELRSNRSSEMTPGTVHVTSVLRRNCYVCDESFVFHIGYQQVPIVDGVQT